MKIVYFYALKCPMTNTIKYIGRSVNPNGRYRQHIHAGKKEGPKDRKAAWIKSLLDKNLKPIMEIIDKIENYKSIEEVKKREEFLIREFKKIYDLKNDRDIVENGYNFSKESREKMSNAQKGNTNKKGKILSEESKLNMGNIIRGRKRINNGEIQKSVKEIEVQSFLEEGWVLGSLPLSSEQKEKLKEAWKNRKPDSEETRERKSTSAITGWKNRKQKNK